MTQAVLIAEQKIDEQKITEQKSAEQKNTDQKDLTQPLTDLIVNLALALVDDKDVVDVKIHTEGIGTRLTLIVSQADMIRVIGKEGRTAKSLRTILAAASRKFQQRYTLEISSARNS